MMEFKKLKTSIAEEREKEKMRAAIVGQAAIIDYIAIMSDIEIPTEDNKNTDMEVQ